MSQKHPRSEKLSDFQILIVDYDKETRQQSASILMEAGFNVIFAESFSLAKELLDSHPIDVLISELDMPGESSVEFVKWVRRIHDRKQNSRAALPFIIVTGTTEGLEQEGLDNYSMQGCLFKPVGTEDLLERITTVLGLNKNKPEATSTDPSLTEIKMPPSEYCRIILSDFINQKVLQMNIYIQLSKEKFVRVAKVGEKTNEGQFRRYFQKGVKYLYVKTADYKKVVDYNLKLNKVVAKSSRVDLEKKQKFLAKTNEIILESVFIRGVNKETFDEVHTYICSSINTLLQEDETFELLENLNQHNDYLYAHSLGVSLYSVLIAQNMGWNSGNNLYKLSIGGLLHDIGKCEIDREIVNKPKSDLTFSEKALVETHAERGRLILQKVKSIPTEVVDIAYEHHENITGQGYPRALPKVRISPMAKIVQAADEFCQLAIENPNNLGADGPTALNLLDQYKHDLVDPEALRALRNLIRKPKKKSA